MKGDEGMQEHGKTVECRSVTERDAGSAARGRTTMFKPASRNTLHSEVMQQMTTAIQNGEWEIGNKLPGEIALADMFQVSRTCIREVLKALAYSGIVEARPGLGTFLREMPQSPSASDALAALLGGSSYTSVLEMRQLLEGQAAYWAVERATPEEIDKLEDILKGEERGETLKDVHTKFHNAVIAMSKNPILIHILTEFHEEFRKYRELNYALLPDADRLEHWKVFEAIKSGSPAKARKAMHQHITFVWKKDRKDT